MDQEILNSYSKLNSLNVSRETFLDFENYITMILEKNKKINIISQNTASKKAIIDRHIIDSAQIIDFVDLNSDKITDLGSGSGMPGIIVAIILKNMKNDINVHLYEKSYHKSQFLKEVSEKLNLKTKIFQKNIFEIKNLETGTIMSRAFKPMPVVLDLVYENFSKYKNLIFFMGKSGKKVFENSKKKWNLEYIEKKSLTSKDSFMINIKKIKKKNNKKILVIDLDPQGNATTGLGLSNIENSSDTIYGVLNGTKEIYKVIKKTQFENLDLVTSNVDLSGLEVETADDANRAFILKRKLAAYLNDSRGSYDYILIDCPPSLSLLTVMALVCSSSLLVPLQTEFFALEGLTQLIKTIERIKTSLNKELEIRGILLTMYDKRNKLSSEVEKEARDFFGEKVYSTVIPRNVRLSEAPSHGMPVLVYDKSCPGSKSYFSFTDEFINQESTIGSAA